MSAPYPQQPYPIQQPQGTSFGKLACIGCVIVLVLGTLALVAFGGLAWFGVNIVLEQVKTELQKNAVVQEHLGTIEDVSMNLTASGADPDPDTMVFDVKGSKGSAKVAAKLQEVNNTQTLTAGTLTLPDGTSHDLFPPPSTAPPANEAPAAEGEGK